MDAVLSKWPAFYENYIVFPRLHCCPNTCWFGGSPRTNVALSLVQIRTRERGEGREGTGFPLPQILRSPTEAKFPFLFPFVSTTKADHVFGALQVGAG